MRKSYLYKAHLFFGLLSGTILVIIALSGAIMAYEPQIKKYLNKDIYEVPLLNKPKISVEKILEDFKTKVNGEIQAVSFSNIKTSSFAVKVKIDGRKKAVTYYVNPYTLEFLGEAKAENFFRTVENIHRTLLLKEFGRQIIGISSILFLILLFSGLYILYPRLKNRFFKNFSFSFKSKGRFFLSSIHSSLGLWFMPIYFVLIITGLTWTYPSYSKAIYNLVGLEKPARIIDKLKIKRSKDTFSNLDLAIKMFNDNIKHKYQFSFVKIPKKGTVYSFIYLDESATQRRERNKLILDISTKQIIKHERYEKKGLNEQIMMSILTIHTGEYFGLIGQSIMFIVCLFVPMFFVTGLLMYRKRKNK